MAAQQGAEADEADDAAGVPVARWAENGHFHDFPEAQEDVGTESKHTLAVVAASVKVLADYCLKTANTDLATVERMNPTELCEFLREFYSGVRQKDGSLYARRSMLTLRYGLQRHFQRALQLDISNDAAFRTANAVFNGRLAELRSSVKLRKTYVDRRDMARIRASGATDCSTPRGLQNTVFLDLMISLARSAYGHCSLRGMKKWHFGIQTDPATQRRFVCFGNKPHPSAASDRGFSDNPISVAIADVDLRFGSDSVDGGGPGSCDFYTFHKSRMYDTPERPAACPVAAFEKYLAKLHPMCHDFWQRPRKSFTFLSSDPHWYDPLPLGKNTLGNKMRDISAEAGCSVVYSNNCLKVPGTRIVNSGYDEMSDNSEVHLSSDEEALSSDGDEQMHSMSQDQYQDDQLFDDEANLTRPDISAVYLVKSEDREENILPHQHLAGPRLSPTVGVLSASSQADAGEVSYVRDNRGSSHHPPREPCPRGIDQTLWTVERSWLDRNNQRKWLLSLKGPGLASQDNRRETCVDPNSQRTADLRNLLLENGHGDPCLSPDLPNALPGASENGCSQCLHVSGEGEHLLLQLQVEVLRMRRENLAVERRRTEAEVAKLEAERLKLDAERRKLIAEERKIQRETK